MRITQVQIRRAIAHEVVRAGDMMDRPPVLSTQLLQIDNPGHELVATRLADTMGSGGHCVEVAVDDATQGSPFDHMVQLLRCGDEEFVGLTRGLATTLSSAQTSGAIRRGSLIVLQGTATVDEVAVGFVAAIKADSDRALYKEVRDEQVSLTYVDSMVLGDSQRLIKIGFLHELGAGAGGQAPPYDPTDFRMHVFDHLMKSSGGGEAAIYFYRTFLKCSIARSAARTTRTFFERTQEFVRALPLPRADQIDLQSDTISFLRGNLDVISPVEFATSVLPLAHQDEFIAMCREHHIVEAFSKDLTLLKGRLRKQSVRFSSQVTITAPPEIFRESVRIGESTEAGWTHIEVRGEIDKL